MGRAKNKARKDGRLQSKVYIGKGEYKYIYAANQKELNAKISDLKIKLGKGIDLSAERDSFGYWKNKYLKAKKLTVGVGWYNALKAAADKLVLLDNLQINKLRKADLEDILFSMLGENSPQGKPYTTKTIKTVKDFACNVMNEAYENRVIEYNPFLKVTVPDGRKADERRALTDEEQRWINETPHRAQTAAMIMMYAGLRRGELIPLTWDKIDLNNATITVNLFVEMKAGQPECKDEGKTDYASRVVDIPQRLVEYLRGIDRTSHLVVTSTRGKMLSASAWERMWESYLAELNVRYGDFENDIQYMKTHSSRPKSRFTPEKLPMLIPNITAHWLRHTFITNMYLAGVDVITAQQQAGHANVRTTLEIYTHLDKEHKKKNIKKLDEFFLDKVTG